MKEPATAIHTWPKTEAKTQCWTGSPESVRVVLFNILKLIYHGAHTETSVSPARRCDFRRRDPADNPGDQGLLWRFVKISEQARFRACCRPPNHPPGPIDGCPQKTSASACGFSGKHPPQPIGGCPQKMSSFWCRVADHMCHGQVPLSVWSGMATLLQRLFTRGIVAHALVPTGAGW